MPQYDIVAPEWVRMLGVGRLLLGLPMSIDLLADWMCHGGTLQELQAIEEYITNSGRAGGWIHQLVQRLPDALSGEYGPVIRANAIDIQVAVDNQE